MRDGGFRLIKVDLLKHNNVYTIFYFYLHIDIAYQFQHYTYFKKIYLL